MASSLPMTTSPPPPHWNVPHVFKGASIIYDHCSWIEGRRLADLLEQKLLSFRVGKRQSMLFGDRVQFEKDCVHVQSTVDDFLLWANSTDETSLSIEHPLINYSNRDYFAYADYMHLPELLDNEQDPLMQMIDWSDIGLINRRGKDSTLWIGSQGSHTPCHYDTYGINFVAQIAGCKRWLLFPPDSSIGDLQTRIPYEESSVYIDIDPSMLSRLKDIDTFDITLEPGDVLFVPKHWWHFVSSLDSMTISVNTWLEQPDDDIERIKEMLVRQIITSTMVAHECTPDRWLNHDEVITDPSTNLTILSSLLTGSEPTEPAAKRCRRSSNTITPAAHVHAQKLTSIPFQSLGLSPSVNTKSIESSAEISEDDILLKRLIRAMTARETIDMIYSKFNSM